MARKPAPGTRDRILDSAARLFQEHGARGVGTQQIIDECGCGKKLLYGEFPSKDDLVVAYLERCQEEWSAIIDEATRPYADDPARQLVALVSAAARQAVAPDFRGCRPPGGHPARQGRAGPAVPPRQTGTGARSARPGRPAHARHRRPLHQRQHAGAKRRGHGRGFPRGRTGPRFDQTSHLGNERQDVMSTQTATPEPEQARWPRLGGIPHPRLRSLLAAGLPCSARRFTARARRSRWTGGWRTPALRQVAWTRSVVGGGRRCRPPVRSGTWWRAMTPPG
jgi:AcrR family transcriptional regulator